MTKFYSFPSGLHLIYHRNRSIETSSIVLTCKTGSINEDKEYHGASHMIEHMVFRGTSKYPDIESLSKVFDNIGADINASTNTNITEYSVKCHSNDFYKCISVLFDMLCCSIFSLKNLQNEKKIVKEELLENKDDIRIECLLNLTKLLFHGTDYERDVIGDSRTINNLTLKNLLKYYKTNYIPSNMFLSIHTNLSYDIILRELKKIKFVTKKKINPKSSYISNLDHIEPENKLVVKYNKLLKQTHLAIGFRFPFGFTDEKRDYIASIIARYLGGTMSSIIYVTLTKKIGAGHTIMCDTIMKPDQGCLLFYTSFEHSKMDEAIRVILDIFENLYEKGISKDRFEKEKNAYNKGVEMDMEDPMYLAQYFAEMSPFGIDSMPNDFPKITIEETNRFVKEYLNPKKCMISMITK